MHVPFAQSLELFNALRGMGGKSVVLLEYKGEGHTFGGATKADLDQRSIEYFDHFLKRGPAPAWWADGVSHYVGQTPVAGAMLSAH